MKFCISYLLLALLLGACSNTPIQTNNQANNQPSNAVQPIVNQAEEAVPEARFSQNLNELMAQVSQTHQIPLSSIEAGFLDAKTISSIRKLVLPPSATFKKNWLVYRQRFIEPVRLKAGRAFWEQNQAFLSQTEQLTGVPAELIVAIIGIETIYGRQTGTFRVKDVLLTLAFSYPD
ncbi:MAG: lytic murein transglycosylase, partial [Betaproteobacteria bacterium]|nr:lytic murein transglycosylase [Betaproteobacteria bacterium]